MSVRNSFANFKWKKFIGWISLIVLLVVGSVVYFHYYAVFSDGYRAGTLIKFSRKGYIFKTYEGELNQGGVANPAPGTVMTNQIWNFSVHNQEVASQLEKMQGKVVRVHYKQFNKMFPWEGDTPYLVNEVELVE